MSNIPLKPDPDVIPGQRVLRFLVPYFKNLVSKFNKASKSFITTLLEKITRSICFILSEHQQISPEFDASSLVLHPLDIKFPR